MLFNMLSLWMFGTELERTWGTRFFTKYYFVTGVGAAVTTLLLARSCLDERLLLAHDRRLGRDLRPAAGVRRCTSRTAPIYFYFLFPIPARIFVMIVGAIAFLSSIGGPGGGIAHIAHLGGLVVGYLYLKGLRGRPLDELKYRWLRWRMDRARSKFDVYSGGKSDDDDVEARVEEAHPLRRVRRQEVRDRAASSRGTRRLSADAPGVSSTPPVKPG